MKDVKQLRKVCKVSQVQMANDLGIDQSNYCNIENGKLIPNNLEEIKEKAIDILYPTFIKILLVKNSELYNLKELHKRITV